MNYYFLLLYESQLIFHLDLHSIIDIIKAIIILFSFAIIFIVFFRTYVILLLGTYVTILCSWLILWQNTLYLHLGRSKMCLIVPERCCSSLVLKLWRLDQETSEEKLFTKARWVARRLRIDNLTTMLGSKTLGTNVLELQFVLCWQTMIKT